MFCELPLKACVPVLCEDSLQDADEVLRRAQQHHRNGDNVIVPSVEKCSSKQQFHHHPPSLNLQHRFR
ncbi:diguanylate cyclase [Anopheles sinensis]|uniref:Diguanylate cyclase n=1 Tax=Anopheles sinensis TaxID=74873 RepID=A0A084WNU8_ANOSI|nr:diguanylate cyclase [Anopheles sinensis]